MHLSAGSSQMFLENLVRCLRLVGGGTVVWVAIDDGLAFGVCRKCTRMIRIKIAISKSNSVFLLQLLRGPGLRGAVHLAGRHHQVADLPPQDGRGAP